MSYSHIEGDLYEDGLALKNGFFRTRHFGQGSEAGSLELFSEGRASEEEEWGMAMGEGEEGGNSNHDVSKQRRDKLEREEFIKKCRVRIPQFPAFQLCWLDCLTT